MNFLYSGVLRFLLIVISILVFSRANVRAQSIGISPASHKFWGETVGISEFYVEYKFVGLHYFQNWDDTKLALKGSNEIIRKTSSPALSVIPVDFTYVRAGMIFFQRRFPVTKASHVHFLLEASLPIRRLTISYRHISNGFGLFNEINPGVDSFSVKIYFGNEE